MEKESRKKGSQRRGKAEQTRMGHPLSLTCDGKTSRALWELASTLRDIAETEQHKEVELNDNVTHSPSD
jgi:hypothetical protein